MLPPLTAPDRLLPPPLSSQLPARTVSGPPHRGPASATRPRPPPPTRTPSSHGTRRAAERAPPPPVAARASASRRAARGSSSTPLPHRDARHLRDRAAPREKTAAVGKCPTPRPGP